MTRKRRGPNALAEERLTDFTPLPDPNPHHTHAHRQTTRMGDLKALKDTEAVSQRLDAARERLASLLSLDDVQVRVGVGVSVGRGCSGPAVGKK